MYLTFLKAVVLILKHATLLRVSNLRKSALTCAERDYQNANIDMAIQQHLGASAPEHSLEQFTSFIMSTDIGWFILSFVNHISYHSFSASVNTEWLKHFLKPNLTRSLFFFG